MSGFNSSADEGESVKNGADIMKKDMTTDHEGKILQMKPARPEKLPTMVPTSTKSMVNT